MKTMEQYFPVVLFIMLYKLASESLDEIQKCEHWIHVKATEQNFLVVQFIRLYIWWF